MQASVKNFILNTKIYYFCWKAPIKRSNGIWNQLQQNSSHIEVTWKIQFLGPFQESLYVFKE